MASATKYRTMWVSGQGQTIAANLQLTLNSQTALGAKLIAIYPAEGGLVVLFDTEP